MEQRLLINLAAARGPALSVDIPKYAVICPIIHPLLSLGFFTILAKAALYALHDSVSSSMASSLFQNSNNLLEQISTILIIQRHIQARFPQWRLISHDANICSAKLSNSVNTVFGKLIKSKNADIKYMLDQEHDLYLRSDALFWEPLLRALKSSSSSSSDIVDQVLLWKMEKLVKESNRNPRDWARHISLAGRVNNSQLASRAFSLMESQQIRITATVFNSLIYAYAFSNRLAKALSLFEVMERTDDCQPTLVTYNTFMSVYSRFGDANNLQAWYDACKQAGFSPDMDTYKNLILGFVKADRYDMMDFAFKEMISSGVMPNLAMLESVIEGYCKQGRLDRMKETLKLMKEEGWVVTEKIEKCVSGAY